MTKEIELKKAAMAFQLKNGEILLISKEDAEEIANMFIVEMCLNNQNQVWMNKSTAIEKCNLLYKIVIEQKDKMSEDVKENYFKAMLEIVKNDEKELVSLQEEIGKSKKAQ